MQDREPENGAWSDFSDPNSTELLQTLALRAEIIRRAGDTSSMLGTAADGASLAIIIMAEFFTKIAQGADLTETSSEYAALFSGFLASRQAGETKMTPDVKTWEAVILDIQERSTNVVDALISTQSTDYGD